jgi:hypothetical protein
LNVIVLDIADLFYYFLNRRLIALESRLRKSDGFTIYEAPGEWLAWWLNEVPECQGDKTRIQTLIQRIQALWAFMPEPLEPTQSAPNDFDHARLLQLEHEVAECTDRYRTSPSFIAGWECRVGVSYVWKSCGTPYEQNAFEALEMLVRSGTIDRLTVCDECGKRWIFKKKKGPGYCGRKCRQKHYEATPKRKAEKNEYNKRYYHEYGPGAETRRRRKGTPHAKS